MKNVNLITSSRRLMALAAIATGVALPQQFMMTATAAQVVQQAGVVKGQVLDSNGEPVIGATVKVGGQKGGTVTDIDGNFSLNAAPGSNLEISYIGFKTQTIKAGKGPIKVTLQDDNQTLSEVVVVGYGTRSSDWLRLFCQGCRCFYPVAWSELTLYRRQSQLSIDYSRWYAVCRRTFRD